MKRPLGWIIVALVGYFIVVQPVAAANTVSNIGGIAADAGDSVTTFFTRLVSAGAR